MRQVIFYFLKQIPLAFIVFKVYPWGKVFEKILLIIAKQKTAAAHDVEGPKRYAAFNAAQGDIQVYAAFLKNKRHLRVVVCGAVIAQIRQ